jgi:hypothetical protein
MPVGCSEAWSSGQAEAFKAPMDPDALGPGPCLHAPAFVCPFVAPRALPCAPAATSTLTGLTLWPQDLAELGEGSAPKEVGGACWAQTPGPPPSPGQRGPKIIISK